MDKYNGEKKKKKSPSSIACKGFVDVLEDDQIILNSINVAIYDGLIGKK